MSCNCVADLRIKLRDRHGSRDIRVAWTDDWASTRNTYRHEHVMFSLNKPDVARAGAGWALCACVTGSTRLGGGWAVLYGRNTKTLEDAFAEVPEPNVIVLLPPGTRLAGGALSRIQSAAAEQGRAIHVERFEDRRSVVLERGGVSYGPPRA